MKLIVVSIVLFHLARAQADDQNPRIIGGKNAPEGKYPYQVSLQDNKIGHFCGGSIINKRWILTAAHCMEGKSSATVVTGLHRLSKKNPSNVYSSDRVIVHRGWNSRAFINDIALIRLSRDIKFDDKVQPIKLPSSDFAQVNYPAVLTGWGRLVHQGPRPDVLQEIDLKVIDPQKCGRMLSNPINKSHICTLNRAGQGACNGDSGGPLVADGVQIGVVSYGIWPCASGSPDVFTRVATFTSWINENISRK